VLHEARRASRRHPRYFLRHARSMGRLFLAPSYWRARTRIANPRR
jgi:hypothetical protein